MPDRREVPVVSQTQFRDLGDQNSVSPCQLWQVTALRSPQPRCQAVCGTGLRCVLCFVFSYLFELSYEGKGDGGDAKFRRSSVLEMRSLNEVLCMKCEVCFTLYEVCTKFCKEKRN